MRCPRCGTETEEGSCPNCGYRLNPGSKRSDSDYPEFFRIFRRYITLISVILFVGFTVFNTSTMLWLIRLILPKTVTNSGVIFLVSPVPVIQEGTYYFALGLFRVSNYTFSIYYIGLIAAIFISYIVLFYKGTDGLVSYFKRTFNDDDGPDKLSGPVMRVACVFAALLFVSYVYLVGLELINISPSTPPSLTKSPLWEVAYSFTNAAVWEEVVVRVVYIGVPMVIYGKIKGHENAKRFLLGGFGLKSRFIIFLIILSSSIFSLAHISSWDIYKIFPTFIAGLGFGYLFAKDGLYSAIILHFVWDYMSLPERILDVPNYNTYFGLLLLFWIGVGGYYSYYFLKHGVKWLFEPEEKKEEIVKEKEVEEEIIPSGTAGVSFAYVCPNCGNSTAVYTENGKLKCKRCAEEIDPESNDFQNIRVEKKRGREWPPS